MKYDSRPAGRVLTFDWFAISFIMVAFENKSSQTEKILIDYKHYKHYKTIYGSVRSACSSCKVIVEFSLNGTEIQ